MPPRVGLPQKLAAQVTFSRQPALYHHANYCVAFGQNVTTSGKTKQQPPPTNTAS